MTELIAGTVLGVWLVSQWGLGGTEGFALIAATAVGVYLLGCVLWPYASCPVCSGRQRVERKDGPWRHTVGCWWCGSVKEHRRVGARLMGRGK